MKRETCNSIHSLLKRRLDISKPVKWSLTIRNSSDNSLNLELREKTILKNENYLTYDTWSTEKTSKSGNQFICFSMLMHTGDGSLKEISITRQINNG